MRDKKNFLLDIGHRMKSYRIEIGLTQERMAEELEMSLNYYGQIERGENGLSLAKLLILNEKFEIDINYLITGKKTLSDSSATIERIIAECPKHKRYDLEQLLKYALNLAQE